MPKYGLVRITTDLEIDIADLTDFIIRGKLNSYAGDAPDRPDPLRPGFKEPAVFQDGPWAFHDSYAGYFMAPGQEWITYDKIPVWMMGYAGGMYQPFWGNKEITVEAFSTLKKALRQPEPTLPIRGPLYFQDGLLTYALILNSEKQDITRFAASEYIWKAEQPLFGQYACGGLVVHK